MLSGARSPAARQVLEKAAATLFVGQFALALAACALARGGTGARQLGALETWIGLAESVLLLRVVAGALRTRPRRLAAGLLLGVVWTAELAALRGYGTFLDAQMLEAFVHAHGDVLRVARAAAPWLVACAAALFAAETALLTTARLAPAPPAAVVLLGLAGLAGPRPRLATPEVRLAAGGAAVLRAPPPPRRGEVALPSLHATRPLPDVLLVVTESVRADAFCSTRDAACTLTPSLDEALPARDALGHMRALASYTAVSVSAIFTGLPQHGARERIARAPILFDFARAARGPAGERYRVAFASAQSREVFEARDATLGLDQVTTLETYGLSAASSDDEVVALGLDRRVAEACEAFVGGLDPSSPGLLVAQLGGTHAPYYVDPGRAPFRPWARTVSWAGLDALRNAYRDAVVAQEPSVAACARAFTRRGRPYVILFTSDHGEAFGEHGAIHHGQNLWDEQLRVPAFLAHGGGALTPEEARALGALGARPTTHLDVLPTLLDAMGLLDVTPWPAEAPLAGRSLLRPLPPLAPTPISNCTGLFPCPLDAWGLVDEDRKLHGQPWDAGWRCQALSSAGEVDAPLDDPGCARLLAASRGVWPTLPNGRTNRP